MINFNSFIPNEKKVLMALVSDFELSMNKLDSYMRRVVGAVKNSKEPNQSSVYAFEVLKASASPDWVQMKFKPTKRSPKTFLVYNHQFRCKLVMQL